MPVIFNPPPGTLAPLVTGVFPARPAKDWEGTNLGLDFAGSAAAASPYYAISGMVGSTMAGSSAAGTVGIMGGTAGTAGATAIAVLTAPATVTTGVVIVGAAAAFEGFCAFFGNKKVKTITPQPTDMRSKYKAHINQL